MMQVSGYDIDELYREAKSRWLKPVEILYILQNHEQYEIAQEAPQKPTSGSLFLFNKRVLRFFRKDGHSWRKKKDGRTVGEAHERLKVGNVEALNCYYAHGEQNPTFQRRSYWMLHPAYEHIVLVHYRNISEGKSTFGSAPQLSGSSSAFSPCPGSYSTCNPASTSAINDYNEQYQTITSPESIEASSKIAMKNNGIDLLGAVSTTPELSSSSDLEVSQALRRLEEQLSLNEDSIKDIPFSVQDNGSHDSVVSEYERDPSKHNGISNLLYAPKGTSDEIGDHAGMQDYLNNFVLFQNEGDNGKHHHQSLRNEYTDGSKDSLSWTDVLDSFKTSSEFDLQDNFQGNNVQNSSALLPQEVGSFNLPAYSSLMESNSTNTDLYPLIYEQGHIGMPLEGASRLTVAQKQNFTIREISPDWAYTDEASKVIIIGSFLCDPSESEWKCMFGDIEVPVQIIQKGVIRCEAPSHSHGKVSLCITSGNRESCSEVKEFEYRVKTSTAHSNVNQTESMKSADELLLLVRFVQVLLSDSSTQKSVSEGSGLRKLEVDDDSWSQVIEALLVGTGNSSTTIDWLLQELLKDKLHQWLSSRSQKGHDQPDCSLSKKEQGIIHMVAGLGFEWALHPILSCGVNIDFRDINGWTALHWAARFGREKMVAALIASGASAGAVTDPSTQDPTGTAPSSIAASNGHKGLAGYLSEVALISHLSSLRLEESEFSKVSAEVEAEETVNNISNGTYEDHFSRENTLSAVRNAVQAASRIQAAFRVHSFRKRQQRESSASMSDEYGITSGDIQELSAMSKLTFGNARDSNLAALSIQKKYRGWKRRKDFLALRHKVVKIQAHVRGYQARKDYKVICWAVGFLDKVVLRWRRKGSGLRGFLNEKVAIDECEDEDILKVFRKQKVDGALDKALKRVLSMVKSPEACQQYQRVLERYRQVKAELGTLLSEEEALSYLSDYLDMENDDILFE